MVIKPLSKVEKKKRIPQASIINFYRSIQLNKRKNYILIMPQIYAAVGYSLGHNY